VSSTILKEAERILTICNACRYCEGFCAVFPAMELRRTFTAGNLKYLANLCHNCRDCYYACQYAPPHEFSLNFPKAMTELRLETYQEAAWPVRFAGLFRRNGTIVSLITALCIAAVMLLTATIQGASVLFGVHTGDGAFYRVIPYLAMVLPSTMLAAFAMISLWKGTCNLWRKTGGRPAELLDLRANIRASWDALRLKYLDGGGYGCNYPVDEFSMVRRYFHHAVFYGFMLCLASTTVAAFYDHFLHLAAPYPVLSWPVMLGTVGGVSILIGTGGLLVLKAKMDNTPTTPQAFGMDIGFLVLLFLTSVTGLLLLLFRSTPVMGFLLAVHLGIVAGMFVTMPYGKFVHGVYRYAALVRNAKEQAEADEKL